mmetsp:Transcript_19613/g.32336  ORF Transcript_19613/g.32336 Transcript_19613/m.32336 type:complete len:361 (-) Transcript_19613:110-1192(-)
MASAGSADGGVGATTPLPAAQLFTLGTMNFVDTAGSMMLLPYAVPFVSHVTGIPSDSPSIGGYVGILVGIYSIMEMMLCYFWGLLADRIGRKPTLLAGLLGSAGAAVGFGFSQTFHWALFFRALDGAFCGNMGVTKTLLGEITDSTNQARGFSLIAVAYSVGMFVGPAFGGYLSSPAAKYPAIFGDLGILQNLAALALLLSQKFGYPYLQPRMGLFKCWNLGWLAIVSSRLIYVPVALLLLSSSGARIPKVGCMAILAAIHMAGAFSAGFPCPTISVWVNRSIPTKVRGAGFGMSSAVGAACRGGFPLVGGALFTLGRHLEAMEGSGQVLLGRYLPVLFGCCVCTIALVLGRKLPASYVQ